MLFSLHCILCILFTALSSMAFPPLIRVLLHRVSVLQSISYFRNLGRYCKDYEIVGSVIL